MNDRTIIGRIEKIDLPEFGIFGIKAKIDTGAFNSSIHCSEVKEVEAENGKVLSFKLLNEKHSHFSGEVFTAHNFKTRRVRSSTGKEQRRYQIRTQAVIGGKDVKIILNLSDRTGMTKAILIGRSSLSGNFLVDVSKKV